MRKTKIKYLVVKGSLNSMGGGSYWEEGRFTNLKEARKFFNKIKRDTKGISNSHYGYVETLIQKAIVVDDDLDFIVDSYKVKGAYYVD